MLILLDKQNKIICWTEKPWKSPGEYNTDKFTLCRFDAPKNYIPITGATVENLGDAHNEQFTGSSDTFSLREITVPVYTPENLPMEEVR